MHIGNELLASVFADSSAFCGKEDVLHALIYHRLLGAGYSHNRLAREQALNNNRIDLVLFGNDMAGDFSETKKKPLVAIEVKGGAYGNRNALKDTIDASGYCTDMAKLKPEAARGGTQLQTVFLGVDGRTKGLPLALVQTLIDESQNLGNGLIYFNRGGIVTTRP